jgi:hypothetical protein
LTGAWKLGVKKSTLDAQALSELILSESVMQSQGAPLLTCANQTAAGGVCVEGDTGLRERRGSFVESFEAAF